MKQKCDCGNIATWLYMPLDNQGREFPCCEYDYGKLPTSLKASGL